MLPVKTPTVVGHDGVLVGEVVGECLTLRRVTMATGNQEEHRARALRDVPQPSPGRLIVDSTE